MIFTFYMWLFAIEVHYSEQQPCSIEQSARSGLYSSTYLRFISQRFLVRLLRNFSSTCHNLSFFAFFLWQTMVHRSKIGLRGKQRARSLLQVECAFTLGLFRSNIFISEFSSVSLNFCWLFLLCIDYFDSCYYHNPFHFREMVWLKVWKSCFYFVDSDENSLLHELAHKKFATSSGLRWASIASVTSGSVLNKCSETFF